MTNIDLSQQKHFAVQPVHNTTTDFLDGLCTLDGGDFSPSLDGATFFRGGRKDTEDQNAEKFQTINTALSPVGGLDGIIIFGGLGNASFGRGVQLVKAVKAVNLQLPVILIDKNLIDLLRGCKITHEDNVDTFRSLKGWLDSETHTFESEDQGVMTAIESLQDAFRREGALIDKVVASGGVFSAEIFQQSFKQATDMSHKIDQPKSMKGANLLDDIREAYIEQCPNLSGDVLGL